MFRVLVRWTRRSGNYVIVCSIQKYFINYITVHCLNIDDVRKNPRRFSSNLNGVKHVMHFNTQYKYIHKAIDNNHRTGILSVGR